jgi:epoxyqueuosine reductase QueG
VRLAVVTTDLPLVQDPPLTFGVQHFCALCKKCAQLCPSGSITHGSKEVVAGVEKWQSKQDGCYRFWRIQGSDCSICIRVCPYSHPDTGMHNFVRGLASRNGISRKLMLKGDDWFYGRRPGAKTDYPDWHAGK